MSNPLFDPNEQLAVADVREFPDGSTRAWSGTAWHIVRPAPGDLAGLRALLTDFTLPICESYAYSAIRHVERNCDIDCQVHGEFGDEPDGVCNGFGRYNGAEVAVLLNTLPALLDAHDAAVRERDAAVREVEELRAVVTRVRACSCPDEWIAQGPQYPSATAGGNNKQGERYDARRSDAEGRERPDGGREQQGHRRGGSGGEVGPRLDQRGGCSVPVRGCDQGLSVVTSEGDVAPSDARGAAAWSVRWVDSDATWGPTTNLALAESVALHDNGWVVCHACGVPLGADS